MLTYLFQSTVFYTIHAVWKVIIFIAPTALVQANLVNRFERWGIQVLVDGEPTTIVEGEAKEFPCTMTVHDRRFFKSFAVDQMMAHGEGYMKGWFDSSDLAKQIELIISNGSRSSESYWFFIAMWRLRDAMVTAANQQTRGDMSMKVVDTHYNLGNDLYSLMLDESMNYTCAFWRDVAEDDLKQAQINKMDLIARKLKLKPGMRVLDIGSGFGATAKYLAEKYKVSVVGYNLSKEQLAFARESCRGLDVTFVEDDYRNARRSGLFDRIYSIGFFEAVGRNNFREYFELVESCLKDDGLHLVHSITLRDASLPRTDEWLDKYIFPCGELPYPQDYFTYSEGILTVEDIHNFGTSYAKTLRVWKKNFIKNWPKLEQKYGSMVNGQFYRMWVNYLDGSIGSFEGRVCQLYQVVQSKQGCCAGAPSDGYESLR